MHATNHKGHNLASKPIAISNIFERTRGVEDYGK